MKTETQNRTEIIIWKEKKVNNNSITFKNKNLNYSIDHKKFIDYLLSTLPLEGYEGKALTTEVEKINFVAQCFKDEYCYLQNLKRYKYKYSLIFEEWAQGLPSALNLLFYNFDIINLFKSIEKEGNYFEQLPEEQQDEVLSCYWCLLGSSFISLFDAYKINYK